MPGRRLPTAAEAAEILARRRTRPARRAAPAAGRSLAPFLKSLDARFGQGPGALQARWPEIVGVDLARRTEPVKVSSPRDGSPGVLEIRVSGPVATLIQHRSSEILDRVNLFLGAGAAGRLRVVQGPLRERQVKAPSLAGRRRPPPLDAAVEADLALEAEPARTDRLRRALVALGRSVHRNPPGSP
ncbi:MAG: DUF721 domain-containing protein [Phenylobacterium sp.]